MHKMHSENQKTACAGFEVFQLLKVENGAVPQCGADR